jgi:uncharacterized protein
MALYVLEYRYTDPDVRARVRPRHLEYMRSLLEDGSLVMAGPWADGSGALVVFHADDHDHAAALVDADPYTVEGASTDHRLREWTIVLPAQPDEP